MLSTHSLSPQRAAKKSPVIPCGTESEGMETSLFTSKSEKPSHRPAAFERMRVCIQSLSFLTRLWSDVNWSDSSWSFTET